jgi:hypothetical protein
MVRRTVMAPHPLALVAGRMRWLSSSMLLGSFPSPSPHTPLARRARRTGESSDDALAAAASAGWCEVEPVALAAALDLPSAAPVERSEAARTADDGRARLVTCGLWLARRRLVAAMLGPGGEARRVIRAALTDDARFGLVEYLAATGAEIVATEALARIDLMPAQAARRGLAVWTVGDALVAALLRAAAIRDPARAAALLARLPVIPLLRGVIRRLVSPDGRQLPLL